MQRTTDLTRRMGRRSSQQKGAAPIEAGRIMNGQQCTAAYIAELSKELAAMASGAKFANLAQLLSRAQLEAELWSGQCR